MAAAQFFDFRGNRRRAGQSLQRQRGLHGQSQRRDLRRHAQHPRDSRRYDARGRHHSQRRDDRHSRLQRQPGRPAFGGRPGARQDAGHDLEERRAQLSDIAKGLDSDLAGLGDSGLVNAMESITDVNTVKSVLGNLLGTSNISSLFGEVGGTVSNVGSNAKKQLKKWGVGGYVNGGAAFLDENFNGTLDPGEPSGYTDSQGGFILDIPDNLTLNTSGNIDDSEAQLVIQGGTDLVTGLPEVIQLMSPGSWTAISPLTTVVALLSNPVSGQGFSVSGAENQVLLATGLPSTLDLSAYDPVGQTLTSPGDANGPAVFTAQSKLEDTVAMVAALFGSPTSTSPSITLTNQIMGVIAGMVGQATGLVNLSDPGTITSIIEGAEAATNVTLDPNLLSGAVQVIVASNQQLDAISPANDLAFIAQVAQVQIAAQGGISNELAAAAAGQETIGAVIADSTGAALASRVAAIPTPPAIVVPSDMLVEATSPSGATANFTVTAFDVGGESLTPSVDYQSGSLFPIGITTVTATATDSLGDTATAQFNVNVVNTAPPTLYLPANIVVEATSAAGAYVAVPQATATDPVNPNPIVTADQSSGIFPLGTTTVNVTATDAAGNSTQGSFTITVQDTTPPTINTPNNLLVEADTIGGAIVALPQVTATDAVDPNPVVSEDQSSGFFPLGTTTVHVTATDFAGNPSTSSFTVTVQDTTPPTINTPANLVVEANTLGGAQVTLPQATATDICDAYPTVTEDHSSGFFPLGTTTVNVSASDASGNQNTSSFTVTVVDTTPPTLNVPANMTVEANTTGGAR